MAEPHEVVVESEKADTRADASRFPDSCPPGPGGLSVSYLGFPLFFLTFLIDPFFIV